MRQTFLEINIDNFKNNVKEIKRYYGSDVTIMPVIKANAYGTYINKQIDLINEFDIVAVAIVDEGIALRNLGYNKEIFILNQPDIEEIDEIIENDLTIGISSVEFLKELKNITQKLKVHIELETGMGRTGVNINNIDWFAKEIKENENIIVEGVYTHLSSADIDFEYTNKQLKIFRDGKIKLKKYFDFKYVHSLASNGIQNFKSDEFNLIRPGIILYGYESNDKTLEKINIKPVAKLKSKINFIKEVEKDTSISYSRKFITKGKTKIATVPIGYADGIPRTLSNKGFVVVNGRKVPIVGNVCMDSFMIDVTNIEDVKVGDFAYIWDNELIKLEEVASLCDTINYEIISRISDRVPRIMISEK